MRTLIHAVITLVGTLTLADGFAIAAPPNVLVITMDNVGYGDLTTYNPSSAIKTPRLDRLADEGARLTSFYTASSTCTVSRACLLTGRVAGRHGLVNQLPGVAGNYGVGLDQREQLIPQYLKNAPLPYATGCFGKWNIGFAPGSRPTERGFDEFIGHASGNIDYYRHNYRERHDLFDGTRELHQEGTYSTDLFADAAIDFIRRRSATDTPWFCYLPFNAPHFPSSGNRRDGEPNVWQAPDEAFAAYGLTPDEADPVNRFYANVTALDTAIGRVLDALDAVGVAENTIVFCMSDNGAFALGRDGIDVGSNKPLRDGGITCWEGGIRVPAFVRWPGHIEPGSVIDEVCWSPDVLATCASLAGATLPSDVTFDGKDLLPMLTAGAESPHESLFFEFRSHAALRHGDWKIVREKPNDPWMLFHIADDIGEQRDLAATEPNRVAALADEFTKQKAEIDATREPPTFLDFIQAQAAALRRDETVPTSLADWQQQRSDLRKRLAESWGDFPEQPAPLEPRVLGTLERDGYRVEKLTFQTWPGVRMTANAYVPSAAGDDPSKKLPAVLCVHGHWAGAKQDPHVQARCIGLAKLGIFVLAVDAFGAGERGIGKALGEYHGEMTAATLFPIGRPLSGLQVYENMRAVDYLLTRPEVDGEQLAITGASGGGNQSMYAGAWDERFKAVIPVCSVGNYQAYLGPACCMCEVVPGALQFTEEWGVLGLTAPRALMVVNASKDAPQFSIAAAEKSLSVVDPVYRLYDQPGRVRHATFESHHDYNQPMREAMYGWVKKHLAGIGDGSPIAEPPMTLEEPETLRCFPGDSRPDDWVTIPRFAAREGRELVERIDVPTSAEDWQTVAIAARRRLESLLGGTEPQWKQISAESSSPREITFSPEPHIILSTTVHDGQPPHRKDVVVIVSCEDLDAAPAADYIAAVKATGRTVATLNLRATGPHAHPRDKIGRAPDHNTAEWSLWIGRPLLGQWVIDIKAALTAINSTTPADAPNDAVTIIGLGPAGIAALAASALDERIDQVVAVSTLSSYISSAPYENQRLALMVPGLLRDVGDVAHLAALSASRSVVIAGGVTGAGKPVDAQGLADTFAFTRRIDALSAENPKFHLIESSGPHEVLKQWK